ncbi:cold shock domain-containing protein [Empedobacter brevis]|uniref:Cold-shock protein n=1 Tax=Empedobacter brevis NBRC 14943 = ATCC 43319 TaxID=1218108 RepID=A0A511NJR7_9FLAO|nr:cold shock domain-containing protein [Empedobacter brevis]GEM52937.1 cold-shock protein [Empedobacter brevis NBRC 14943 = ATCC 43319]
MADSYSKKENIKKKEKKREEKRLQREERKTNNNKGKSLEEMIAYVDINGNLTDVPPHLQNREEDLLSRQENPNEVVDPAKLYTGIVNSLNEKGFGFITEEKTNDSIFFHQSQLKQEVKKYDKVTYKKEVSEKGFRAIEINKK